jgi:pyruvate dehydrogenase E2 component (dihydrolipoamide acetyltransferase)
LAADVREYVPPVVAERPTETIPPEAVRASAPAHASTVEKVAGAPIHGAGSTDYPVSEAGRGVAARLTVAKQTVPHYYLTVDLELDKLLSLRETLNKELGEKEMGLSVNDFLLKAAALASKKVPEANASWHGDFVRQYHTVDVNLVLGVGDGLLAPVIRNVDSKGLRALSAEVAGLLGGAERGELSEEALQTGTFTLINVGMYGVKAVAPIVSLPQACVLGVGAIENRVVPAAAPPKGEAAGEGEGEVYRVVPGVTVTLSCDHRVIDGAVGAQWLSAFKSLVEEPMTLLL